MTRIVECHARTWPMREPFVISRKAYHEAKTLEVVIFDQDGRVGRGEASGVDYRGETIESMIAQVDSVSNALSRGLDRRSLLDHLPPGGARCAIDCALWDLEAKQSGVDPFQAAGVLPNPVMSAFTIGIRSVADYEATATRLAQWPLLKVKVSTQNALEAVEAVHRGAPGARLIVDPNQAWSVDDLYRVTPKLAKLNVALIEQPIPIGSEGLLDRPLAVPLCADELINDIKDLALAVGRFEVINIKLDKTGGLTAALALAQAAQALGLRVMVGCMGGSSLSMAPAMVLAQQAQFVDLDGPLLQATDREDGFAYQNGVVEIVHKPLLWG